MKWSATVSKMLRSLQDYMRLLLTVYWIGVSQLLLSTRLLLPSSNKKRTDSNLIRRKQLSFLQIGSKDWQKLRKDYKKFSDLL